MLGMLATKMVSSLEECAGMIRSFEIYQPQEKEKQIYKKMFGIYKETVEQLTPMLKKLAEF